MSSSDSPPPGGTTEREISNSSPQSPHGTLRTTTSYRNLKSIIPDSISTSTSPVNAEPKSNHHNDNSVDSTYSDTTKLKNSFSHYRTELSRSGSSSGSSSSGDHLNSSSRVLTKVEMKNALNPNLSSSTASVSTSSKRHSYRKEKREDTTHSSQFQKSTSKSGRVYPEIKLEKEEDDETEMGSVNSDNGVISSLDIAQKEIDLISDNRKLKLKWTQWQRAIIRQEFASRWLKLRDKEIDAVPLPIIDQVIKFTCNFVKYTMDLLVEVNDSLRAPYSSAVRKTLKEEPKTYRTIKTIKRSLRKLAVVGAQIAASRQLVDSKSVQPHYYENIMRQCTREAHGIPTSGQPLYSGAPVEEYLQKIAEIGTLRRAQMASQCIRSVLSQIVCIFLSLSSPKASPTTYYTLIAAIRSFQVETAELLNSVSTMNHIATLKSGRSNGTIRVIKDDVNIWNESKRATTKVNWSQLEEEETAKEKEFKISKHKRGGSTNSMTSFSVPLLAVSFNKLVERVTSEDLHDVQLQKNFILALPTFASPFKLLTKLQQRFEVPEEQKFVNTKQVQLRVCIFLKYWIQAQFDDFSDSIIGDLMEYIESTIKPAVPEVGTMLNKEIDDRILMYQARLKDLSCLPLINITMSATDLSPLMYVFSYSPSEIARQLTLHDYTLFRDIQPSELLNQTWNKPQLKSRSPSITMLTSRSIKTTQWVTTAIQSAERQEDRLIIFNKILSVIEELYSINNFHTMHNLLVAAHRLASTNSITTNEEHTSRIAKFEAFISVNNSDEFHRQTVAASKKPCLPYMNSILRYMEEIDGKFSDYDNGLINFMKREQLFTACENVQDMQRVPYDFPISEPLFTFLQELPH